MQLYMESNMSNEKLTSIEIITNQFIEMMESPKTWQHYLKDSIRQGHAKNLDNKSYSGINQFYLSIVSGINGYASNQWGTYKAISEKGGNVLKGSKGVPIVFYSVFEKENKSGDIERIPTLKSYIVFNVAQTENLPESFYVKNETQVETFTESLKISLGEYESKIVHESCTVASYSSLLDRVKMPLKEYFKNEQEYYSTLFHELSHLTGHESRLNRKFGKFGTHAYAIEELVAELSANLIAIELNISNVYIQENSAAYLQNWIQVLKESPKALIKFMSEASKASQMILEQVKIENKESIATWDSIITPAKKSA